MNSTTPVPGENARELPGSGRVLTMSTISFTVMFAVWMMFGILQKPISKELGLSEEQYSWVLAAAILNGSMWRLPAGMIADRIGGKKPMVALLLLGAIPAYLVSHVHSYPMLLLLSFLVGFVGNSFTVGVSWNSAWFSRAHQGSALGLFGAGNVGASVTKFIAPPLIAATTGATYLGVIQGGWRLVPVIYAALLVLLAVLTLVVTPMRDRTPGATKSIGEMLVPLREVRVWRFSLYYVAVFGAYVALSGTLPLYYQNNYDQSLTAAGLLTATFIFPASLLRPVGGWFSDRFGARRAMYGTFTVMLVVLGILMMPAGHLVITHPDGHTSEHLPWSLGLVPFVVLVFVLGCAMGIGKAAVYKHIPEYFPDNVGSVGGLVGMLGGLGGFFLPPLFAYTKAWTGFPASMFFVLFLLTLVCMAWMHWTVVRMLHASSPELADHFEHPGDAVAARA